MIVKWGKPNRRLYWHPDGFKNRREPLGASFDFSQGAITIL